MSAPSRHFWCPRFQSLVELTAERSRHVEEGHPDLLPSHAARLRDTLLAPDRVRPSSRRPCAWLFSRWYPDGRLGRHVVVVVIQDAAPSNRYWVATAYHTRRLPGMDRP